MITINNYDTISFNYVKVSALVALARDPIVVAIELVGSDAGPPFAMKKRCASAWLPKSPQSRSA